MEFPTAMDAILQRIDCVQPLLYHYTRNYIDGSVSYLSPYLSRGVVSTRYVVHRLLYQLQYTPTQLHTFIKEIAWREYWQRVWQHKGDAILHDMRNPQLPIRSKGIPDAVVHHHTGIQSIDTAIKSMYQHGYMHNHLRMYTAALVCNIAQCHWLSGAKWMYYHLLDADPASNMLSWQWIAGTNSHKKYIANQDNINKYTYSNQKLSFLDYAYDQILENPTPDILQRILHFEELSVLPRTSFPNVDMNLPTVIYNPFQLDPFWKADIHANRILLLEPSLFAKFPMSSHTIQFILNLAKNISTIQVFSGEFADLQFILGDRVYYKVHPTTLHYTGIGSDYEFLFQTNDYFTSFSKYWKQCEYEMKKW